MPLVTANQASGNDKKDEWTNKLVGKNIHEDDSESTVTSFAKRELPEDSRVIKPGMMVTKDFRENRLNVHVDDEGICSHVTIG